MVKKQTTEERIQERFEYLEQENRHFPKILVLGRREYNEAFYESYGTARYEDRMGDQKLEILGVEILLDKNSETRWDFYGDND
jgi:hypothetical protein